MEQTISKFLSRSVASQNLPIKHRLSQMFQTSLLVIITSWAFWFIRSQNCIRLLNLWTWWSQHVAPCIQGKAGSVMSNWELALESLLAWLPFQAIKVLIGVDWCVLFFHLLPFLWFNHRDGEREGYRYVQAISSVGINVSRCFPGLWQRLWKAVLGSSPSAPLPKGRAESNKNQLSHGPAMWESWNGFPCGDSIDFEWFELTWYIQNRSIPNTCSSMGRTLKFAECCHLKVVGIETLQSLNDIEAQVQTKYAEANAPFVIS